MYILLVMYIIYKLMVASVMQEDYWHKGSKPGISYFKQHDRNDKIVCWILCAKKLLAYFIFYCLI